MNNNSDGVYISLLAVTFFLWSAGMYSAGEFYGNKEGINQGINSATIQCIEKPNKCKDRYDYLKLSEKLSNWRDKID